MKKTLLAQAIGSICSRLQYHITEQDKSVAQPFYDKIKEQIDSGEI